MLKGLTISNVLVIFLVCDGNIKQNSGTLSFPMVKMSSIFCQWSRTITSGTMAIKILNASRNAKLESSCPWESRYLMIAKGLIVKIKIKIYKTQLFSRFL